jgi:hypothetical protein
MPRLCAVCMDAPITHGFSCPAGIHVCVCATCGPLCPACPICRAESRLVACFMATADEPADEPDAAAAPAPTRPALVRVGSPIPNVWERLVDIEEREAAAAAPAAAPAAPAARPPPRPRKERLSVVEDAGLCSALTTLFAAAPQSDQCRTNRDRAIKRGREQRLVGAVVTDQIHLWHFAQLPVFIVQYKSTGTPQLSRGLKIDTYDAEAKTIKLRNAAGDTVPWELVFGPKIQ